MSTTTKTFAPNDTATPADPRSVVEARNSAGTTGRTTVADVVVQKIAGRAAREISGVYDFGGGARPHVRRDHRAHPRRPGQHLPRRHGRGRRAAGGDRPGRGRRVRRHPSRSSRSRSGATSSRAVEQLTGLEVVEVNINVNDLHLPEDEVEVAATDGPRVQLTRRLDRTADAVAAAVLGRRAVARLHGGPFGTTTTDPPGRRLAGAPLRPRASRWAWSAGTARPSPRSRHRSGQAVAAPPTGDGDHRGGRGHRPRRR